jgi:uncharacterized OsmC-like protein
MLNQFMSNDRVELTQLENGDFMINFNNKDMSNLHIHDWLNSDFSCRTLLAAAAVCCASGSTLYELNLRKPGARYNGLKSSVTWRNGEDEKGRKVVEALDVKVQVDVPEEHLEEFKEVLREHEDNMCFVARSLVRGIKVKMDISSI